MIQYFGKNTVNRFNKGPYKQRWNEEKYEDKIFWALVKNVTGKNAVKMRKCQALYKNIFVKLNLKGLDKIVPIYKKVVIELMIIREFVIK